MNIIFEFLTILKFYSGDFGFLFLSFRNKQNHARAFLGFEYKKYIEITIHLLYFAINIK